MWLWLSKPMGPHFRVGEITTHFRTYFSGDWDVHWGYGILTHGHVFGVKDETGNALDNCMKRVVPSLSLEFVARALGSPGTRNCAARMVCEGSLRAGAYLPRIGTWARMLGCFLLPC